MTVLIQHRQQHGILFLPLERQFCCCCVFLFNNEFLRLSTDLLRCLLVLLVRKSASLTALPKIFEKDALLLKLLKGLQIKNASVVLIFSTLLTVCTVCEDCILFIHF